MAFTLAGRAWQLVCQGPGQLSPWTPDEPDQAWTQRAPTSRFDACQLLRQLMADEMDGTLRRALLSAPVSSVSHHTVHRLTHEQVIAQMAQQLSTGQVVMRRGLPKPERADWFPMPVAKPGQAEQATPPALSPSRLAQRASTPEETEPPQTHWIEIELLGEDNKPIAWEPYLVELPNGHRITGSLDDQGFTRISGIAMGGQCKVAFPKLDKDAWEYVHALPARPAANSPSLAAQA